ncbi:zinc finger HIT domain-containing protein 3 isoform X2 [Harpegnathos saltator]|uniref:zinc finger HIT domain-containing protein 3 isoform X2 n=2 Tax=Harpegnathos saltator TaxID=610380 RepID=UPI00058CB3DE|nr:zinc finger HIT domain-containing protein 3 isoform X2 [Harpegnathos saltator]
MSYMQRALAMFIDHEYFICLSCSVTCCKGHKVQGCELPKVPEKSASPEKLANSKKFQIADNDVTRRYMFPTEDTVPIEKLEQLRYSNELKECLANPHVRNMMKEVVNSHNPTLAIARAMTEPIFVEMADACLRIVELPEEDRPC